MITDEEFRAMIQEALTNASVSEIAYGLGTSLGTITRWRDGHSSPAQAMRLPAKEWLKQKGYIK